MITLLYFGQIQGITKLSKEEISFIGSLNDLRTILFEKYPNLQAASFVFSVNKKICTACSINERDEVALLPPFSGG